MSFQSYDCMMIRQQELARADFRRADAQAAQIAGLIGRLGRSAAQAVRTLRRAASVEATMHLRRIP